jgi:hypothetical protein
MGVSFQNRVSRSGVISNFYIWRMASLMIKSHGKYAEVESSRRADEFAKIGDENGAAVWRGVARAVGELTNTTSKGPVH